MGIGLGLKSYLQPGKAKKAAAAEKHNAPVVVADPALLASSFPPTPGFSGMSTPGFGSRPASLFHGEAGRGAIEMNDMKCDVMANYLHQQQQERMWVQDGEDEGVVLKKSRGQYTCCPSELQDNPYGFAKAIEMLNVRVCTIRLPPLATGANTAKQVAMTVSTKVIKLFLMNTHTHFVPLSNGLRLQVLPDISYLPRCQKHQFAAFIADRQSLVVWDDSPRHLLSRVAKIEAELMEMIWQGEGEVDEKKGPAVGVAELSSETASDVERADSSEHRPICLWNPIHVALTITITIAAIGAGWRNVAIETFVDHNYLRLLFVLVTPLQFWAGLFFFQAFVGQILQLFGPINQLNQNTKFYTGIAPKRLNRDFRTSLPHVTIQMPVYKEGLKPVIEPTIHSIKAAISTYEMQGGTANIFINDDGMQLISEDDARARQDFYDEHNIGWVARPKHNPKPKEGEEVFLRRGKFKKASNMNYAMWVSVRVEDKLAEIARHEKWTQEDEANAYQEALNQVVAEDEGRTWADGNVRMGDYILIIDSDTRVPTDCFLDAVSEMEQCPQVAIIQYPSGVMNVTESFFERGITFFTNMVYTQIRYAVASGDVAPFVGHNAVLRWAALQEIAYDCPDDHKEKFWSESTVSEDFDMALRLQTAGYIVRMGGYTGGGFKEGVSLTCYDELARWEKYAYGCSELIFHPLRYWPTRGPFTPLFRHFIRSNMPLGSKFTIMAYIGTYYAIGSSWLLTLGNYFLTGWFNGHFDHYYLDSFKIYFAIIIVFSGLGNIALAVLRYRTEEKALLPALVENFKWLPLITIFLGGISLHVSQALLSHLFSVDMSWGATSKEAENTTFFKEIPKVLKSFKFTFLFVFLCTAMIICLATVAPYFWQVRLFIAIFPLSAIVAGHFLLPIVLNPNLMLFTW